MWEQPFNLNLPCLHDMNRIGVYGTAIHTENAFAFKSTKHGLNVQLSKTSVYSACLPRKTMDKQHSGMQNYTSGVSFFETALMIISTVHAFLKYPCKFKRSINQSINNKLFINQILIMFSHPRLNSINLLRMAFRGRSWLSFWKENICQASQISLITSRSLTQNVVIWLWPCICLFKPVKLCCAVKAVSLLLLNDK